MEKMRMHKKMAMSGKAPSMKKYQSGGMAKKMMSEKFSNAERKTMAQARKRGKAKTGKQIVKEFSASLKGIDESFKSKVHPMKKQRLLDRSTVMTKAKMGKAKTK